MDELIYKLRSDIKNLTTQSEQIAQQVTNLNDFVGLSDVLGIGWNPTSDTYRRLGQAINKTFGVNGAVNDFAVIAPYSQRRVCNLADDGVTVNAYFGDGNYVENGTNGQVMTEHVPFWYKAYVEDNEIITLISPTVKTDTGWSLHPWFIDDVTGLPVKRYFSTYEGCLWDSSASAYILNDAQVADFTVGTGDKLSSITGAKPISGHTQNLTRSNARKLANNRGTRWQQQHNNAVAAIQMMMLIEIGDYKSQERVGQGVVSLTDDGSTNMAIATGDTSALGNGSGWVLNNGQRSVRYGGIENFWGNIWKWVDGVNVTDSSIFVSRKNSGFVDDIFTGDYQYIGEPIASASGYVSNLVVNTTNNYTSFPKQTTGSSSTKIGDYLYRSTGVRGALLGGDWYGGAFAGARCWALGSSSGNRSRDIGSRIVA